MKPKVFMQGEGWFNSFTIDEHVPGVYCVGLQLYFRKKGFRFKETRNMNGGHFALVFTPARNRKKAR